MSSCVCHGYEDPNLREKGNYFILRLDLPEEAPQYHEETDNLLKPHPYENNANTNRPRFATKKKSWAKYFSFLSKFTKQSKTSLQKKTCYNSTWKSKLGPKFGPATGVACKFASIHEAMRKRASRPLLRCFHATKEEEGDLPYIQLEKFGHGALRREAFGPIYMVT